jgi:hypothetical protein
MLIDQIIAVAHEHDAQYEDNDMCELVLTLK